MSTNGTTKKRRRPYGRVCERPDGKGVYVQFPDPSGAKGKNGRTRYVTRAVASKREGERYLAELRKAKLAGTLLARRRKAPGGDLTVRQAIDGHIEALRAKGGSEATIALYGYSLKPLENQGLAGRRVRDVTAADVEAYLGWRRKNVWRTQPLKGGGVRSVRVKGGRASASTIARDRELLHAAFGRLRRLGEIETNVVASVPKPKRKAKKRVVLSKAEVARFLAACRRHLRPVALALAYTGARKGEILALRWRDLNFEDGTIALARPKVSNFSQIPLHPGLAAELLAVREARAEARGRPVPDSEHVFLSRYGKPFKSFKTAWQNAVERAGLADKGVTPHAMRHSFACHFLAGGAAVTDLQAMLGHASLATTQIYARMVDRRTRASVEALDFGSTIASASVDRRAEEAE